MRNVSSLPLALLVGLGVSLSACSAAEPSKDSLLPAGGDGSTSPGNDGSSSGDDDSGGPSFDLDAASLEAAPACSGLQCQQAACAAGTTTTISGIVYDPAGKNPLYDVAVYVPNAPLAPLPSGASCGSCDSLYSGSPLVSALTDASGHFTITHAPSGANIPLVIQIGKWRRQFTLSTVKPCVDNPQPDKSLGLPHNHTVGDIPNIAISTGGADTLECLLRRIGLDASEYGPADTNPAGRIHIYQGSNGPNTSPAAPAASKSLWNSQANLMKYDIVLLSCEGSETTSMNQQALFDYASAGGRVFGSHFHYSWFNTGPFGADNLAKWTTGTQSMNNITADITTTLASGAPFPKGVALKQWLGNVGGLNAAGKLAISDSKHNANVTAANVPSQPWIVADSSASSPGATEYFTFNTPVGAAADKQCGRVVYSDLHVGAASNDYASLSSTVPAGCGNGNLSPQEKALEFMLFDLSACVVPDGSQPIPPQTPPQ
jgi:hypothetical protein